MRQLWQTRLGNGRRLPRLLLLTAGAVLLVALAACQVSVPPFIGRLQVGPQGEQVAPAQTTAQTRALAEEESAFPGSKIDADNYRAPVGAKATIKGAGFPANSQVSLVWKGFEGSFVLEQEEVVFVGPRYEERAYEIAQAKTDTAGAFNATFTVPEDFGGVHDLVARVDGKFATKMGFWITPSFSISKTSGPAGTPLEIHATGLGYRTQESQWHVTWDDGFTGYMTGITTRGTATARIRMAGTPGPHVLKIWRNYRGIPYLNPHQGPFGPLPEPNTFIINVTPGAYDAPAVWADPKPEDTVRPAPEAKSQGGARLALSTDQGMVGSKITISGEGYPANQPVQLTWASRQGQKITDTGLLEGFDEKLTDLPEAKAGPDGRFSTDLTIFDDFAGYHRITASSGNRMAEAYYSIYASIFAFTQQAKVGEDVSIHMKGVGWNIQGKTYAVVYDNRYLGYGCSFSTRGDIDMHIPAAGAPGVHTIDLYPSVYEGRAPTPDIYSKPNLAYLENHPGGPLPAFRLTLIVTE